VTTSPPAECWLHPDVEVCSSAIEGHGLFAGETISYGTVVMRVGGRIVPRDELEELIIEADRTGSYVDCISIDEGLDLVMVPAGHEVHFGNHSCDPNLWHVDAFTLAARRDIAAGDEITIDYATQTDNPGFTLDCRCGSSSCRGTVTGADWRSPELQQRYGEHWTPALLHRIAQHRR
jgi:SET domain-containing protein